MKSNKLASAKTIKYFKDLIGYGYGDYLPKGFNPKTQKEYGLGIDIMADAQWKKTNGAYGKPRKSTLNKIKKEQNKSEIVWDKNGQGRLF